MSQNRKAYYILWHECPMQCSNFFQDANLNGQNLKDLIQINIAAIDL